MYNDDNDNDDVNKVEEAAPKYNRLMTPAEFLEWEIKQEERYEYIDGEIIPVEAASGNHSTIVVNISGEIYQFLKGKPCLVHSSQLRISAKSMRSYFYPDASIFCQDPEEIDMTGETYKNPTVIFEVLSPSTANYDLNKKKFFYMQIESLREYIMIDSRKVEVCIGKRQADNSWTFETFNSFSDRLFIESIGMPMPLNDIYSRVKF